MADTLEDVLNTESASDLSTQLGLLTTNAKSITKPDLEKLMKGDFQSLSFTKNDVQSLKDLAVHRIKNDLSIYPFTQLDFEDSIHPLY